MTDASPRISHRSLPIGGKYAVDINGKCEGYVVNIAFGTRGGNKAFAFRHGRCLGGYDKFDDAVDAVVTDWTMGDD